MSRRSARKAYRLGNGISVQIQRNIEPEFGNFLTSAPIKNMLIEKADKIRAQAQSAFDDDEESYELVVQDFDFSVIGRRTTVAVRAKSPKARYIEGTDSQLLKSLDAARD
jgi:hypothetical protein